MMWNPAYTPMLVRFTRHLTLVLALALVAAACGGGDQKASATAPAAAVTTLPDVTAAPSTTTSAPTTTVVASGPPSLLNGLPVQDEMLQDRRVVAVKIDNHPDARPQSGVQDAGAVIELIVEAGITRFIALFHDTDSDYVGPIRSGRPTDPTLLRQLEPVFQISGAQPWVQGLINSAEVPFLGETRPNTFRIPRGGRAYERTLYGNTEAIREVADGRSIPDDPPQDSWFSFGEPTATTETAEDVALSWSGDWPTVHWVWDGTEYSRFNGTQEHTWVDQEGEGEQITADTLLVLTARRYTASGSSGSAVPALDTVGEGEAYLFYNGEVVEGTWQRETIEEFFELLTVDGEPIVLPPGKLWLNVFPNDRTVSWDQ